MKKYVQLFLLSCISVVFTFAQSTSFQKVNSNSYPSFNEIRFVNETTGWVVGLAGSIYKSIDAGQTWHEQRSNTTNDLNAICFLTDQIGFVSGENSTLLSTTNGGTSWKADSISAIPTVPATIYSIYFSDNLKGWMLASSASVGWILSTTDGGETWNINLTTTKPMNKMSFFSPNKGMACGKDAATIYYTSDGTTWTQAPTPALGGFTYTRSDLRNIFMVSATEAYIVGWGSTVGAQPSIHLKTTNAGVSWTYLTQLQANRTYDNLWNVSFKDANNGIAIGGASRGSVVVRTTDAGQNWIPIAAPFGPTLYGISSIGNKVWLSGSSGLLAYSSDYGDTWQLLTPIPSGTIYSLNFPTSKIGYAAGFDGVLHKTTDGGETWKGGFLTIGFSTLNIQAIQFLDENLGFAACSFQMVAKTTDGGKSWVKIINDTTTATATSYGVHFVNQNLGFVVGKIAANTDIIYKTTDGGASWSNQQNLTSKDWRAVDFADENHGIVVGLSLKVRYTNDGGSTWLTPIINNVSGTPNIYSVKFINDSEAVAVGVNFIMKSNDAGATWNNIQTASANQLNSVAFKDQSLGYAVGAKEAWQTTDAGNSWTDIYTANANVFEGTLYSAVVDPDGNAWFGGANSGIFTNRIWSDIKSENNSLVDGFSLEQNYPNPFNPTTVIQYKLEKDAAVSLDVYDVLGKNVAKLINAHRPAGDYSQTFEAGRLSGGVYFYTLKVDGSIRSKKMIFIK